MLSSTIARAFALSAAFVIGLTVVVPARPAQAHHPDPPFEVRFPQETDKTHFSNTWGVRRSGGRRHQGSDLMAPKMTEVYAIADGVVSYVGTSSRPGRFVVIHHGEGWESYYIHLNNDSIGTDDGDAPWSLTLAPGVEKGADVKAGQLIGWVGDSGNAEGGDAHTHFELRRNGSSMNPYQYLRAAWERDHTAYILRQAAIERGLDGYEIG